MSVNVFNTNIACSFASFKIIRIVVALVAPDGRQVALIVYSIGFRIIRIFGQLVLMSCIKFVLMSNINDGVGVFQ